MRLPHSCLLHTRCRGAGTAWADRCPSRGPKQPAAFQAEARKETVGAGGRSRGGRRALQGLAPCKQASSEAGGMCSSSSREDLAQPCQNPQSRSDWWTVDQRAKGLSGQEGEVSPG